MRKGKNLCSGSSKEFLRNPEINVRLGARPPRSILLVSMPGTGKTLLAKAVAGEADVFFISCSASEFVELYVGMVSSRVRGPKGRLLLSFSLMRSASCRAKILAHCLATLSGGGLDESGGAEWGRDQGHLVDMVQTEVKGLLQSALEVALSVIKANPTVLEGLGAYLEGISKLC